MVPEKSDTYMMWGDYYVAWPLSVPSKYPDWMLVSFEENSFTKQLTLLPVQALPLAEVAVIKRRSLLYWGMKVANQEWSLVLYRPSYNLIAYPSTLTPPHDPSRSVGV